MQTSAIHSSTEVAIIGGGPIGIEAAIAFKELGVESLLFEAQQIGEAFRRWPPHTHFFSTSEHVALAGVPVQNLSQQPITGEEYLAYLRMLVEYFDLNLHNYEPVIGVDPVSQDPGEGYILRTAHRTGERRYRARYVVFATGGMDAPRLLHIPGEDLPHVSHYFEGPHKYFRTRLLIVGGRNSAAEAALRCWRAGAEVHLSYRRADFDWDRIKPHLAGDLQDRLKKGEITFYPATVPVAITPQAVKLAPVGEGDAPGDSPANGHTLTVEPDFVLLATGFVMDPSLLRLAGVALQGEAQQPVYDQETMQTNRPGIYVAGTAAGGTQGSGFKYFISTTHDHIEAIVRHITGRPPKRLGSVDARNNAVHWREVEAN
jgi:thioredoxin reductase (NADPH)